MTAEAVEKTGRLNRFTAAFAAGIGLAVARFPVTSLLIAAFAGSLSLVIEGWYPSLDAFFLRAQSALASAGALAAAVVLLGEARGWAARLRHGTSLLAAVLAGLAVIFAAQLGVFAPPLVAALFLAVPLAPYVARSSSLGFWTFVHWGAFAALLAFVSVLLFVLGVTAIFEMVRYLFDVGIPQRAYQHLYVVACAFIGPLFALGRVPQDLTEEAAIAGSTEDRLSSGLGTLQDWIASPLALVVALVLHIYIVKVVLTGELPKNQIGWIVGSFALFVLTVRITAYPFLACGGVATRLFGRVWAATLLLPLLLLLGSVWLRIADEGVTGERYYLGLAALATGSIVFAQAVPRLRGDIRFMAAMPVLLLALSSFGPLGVASTVARSQIALLDRALPTLRLGGDATGLSEEQRHSVRSRIEALGSVDALPRLLPYLDELDREAVANAVEGSRQSVLLERLGLGYGTPSPLYRSFAASKPTGLDIGGFDMVFTNLSTYGTAFVRSPDREAPPEVVAQDREIAVRYTGVLDRFDASAIVAGLPSSESMDASDVVPAVADVRTQDGRSLRLFIRSATFDPATHGGVGLSFDLALHRAEWPSPAGSLGGDGQR